MSLILGLSFLLWILGAAVRAGPVEEVGKLLICEQTCLTAQFSLCHCPLGSFECLCKCPDLVPSLQSCAGTRCSGNRNETIQTFVDTILCPKPKSSTSSTTRTSTTTTTTSSRSSSTSSSTSSSSSIITSTSRTVPPTPTPTCTQSLHGNGTHGATGSNCLVIGGANMIKRDVGGMFAAFVLVGAINRWIGF